MPLYKQALLRRLHAPENDPADGGKGGGGGGKPTDKDVLDGKGVFDGDPAGKGGKKDDPPKVERVKVKVGNDEIETDAASAAALNTLLQANAQLTALVQKGYTAPKPDPTKKAEDTYDYETGLFTEPKVALARLRAELKAEVMGEVSAAYTQAEAKKDFWSGFYAENKDLTDEKFIVEAVLGREWPKLKDLAPADASKKLAEAAKKELMRLSGGKSPSDPNPRPVEGGGDGKNPTRSGKAGEEKILSLSDVIRARKEARRKAQFSKE